MSILGRIYQKGLIPSGIFFGVLNISHEVSNQSSLVHPIYAIFYTTMTTTGIVLAGSLTWPGSVTVTLAYIGKWYYDDKYRRIN